MDQSIEAIYENGVFRPQEPVHIANGERVTLIVSSKPNTTDLSDVADLLDEAYIKSCGERSRNAPLLDEVRKSLTGFGGSLSEFICQERDER